MIEESEVHLVNEKIDLSENTCPNREERANGINLYYGKASDLVKDARAGKLKQCDRKFQQTSGCTLNFYLTVREFKGRIRYSPAAWSILRSR